MQDVEWCDVEHDSECGLFCGMVCEIVWCEMLCDMKCDHMVRNGLWCKRWWCAVKLWAMTCVVCCALCNVAVGRGMMLMWIWCWDVDGWYGMWCEMRWYGMHYGDVAWNLMWNVVVCHGIWRLAWNVMWNVVGWNGGWCDVERCVKRSVVWCGLVKRSSVAQKSVDVFFSILCDKLWSVLVWCGKDVVWCGMLWCEMSLLHGVCSDAEWCGEEQSMCGRVAWMIVTYSRLVSSGFSTLGTFIWFKQSLFTFMKIWTIKIIVWALNKLGL